ncbi:MAG TPA: response regulator [Candidatus Acidoferrales bacterium]|nr:response regulator [Candidatus Acidoferrales bacterium]
MENFSYLFILNKPSILIIDDDQSILKTLTRIFERNNYNVAVATKGAEAIEKLNNNHFDVALIDYCLPDMEGTALFEPITHSSPKTVKIMLTGRANELCGLGGLDALLSKPVQPGQLLSLIDSKLKDKNIEA